MYGASNDRDNGEHYSVAGVIVLFVLHSIGVSPQW